MISLKDLNRALTASERRTVTRLNTPPKIQGFLDELSYSTDRPATALTGPCLRRHC